jgi:hypothetical protein
MTTSKGLGISIKYGDQSREMELRVNQHALGVRVPQGDNLRLALLRKWRRMGDNQRNTDSRRVRTRRILRVSGRKLTAECSTIELLVNRPCC